MFSESITSIKATLYERISSPLLGSYIISFLIWNYKLIILIFSKSNADVKINFINDTLYPQIIDYFNYWFLFPSLTTLFFIFIYPIPAKFVYEHTQTKKAELKKIKQNIEDESLLTKKESYNLKRKIINLEYELDDLITRKNNEIKELKAMIDNYNNSNETTGVDNKEPQTSITDNNKYFNEGTIDFITRKYFNGKSGEVSKYLLDIIEKNDTTLRLDLFHDNKYEDFLIDHSLDILLEHDLIRIRILEGDEYYKITPNGRKVLYKLLY